MIYLNKNIIKKIMIFTEILLFVCMISVFNVVTTRGKTYMEKAVNQRKTSDVVKNIRGKIYDRNMISFVEQGTDIIKTPGGELSIPGRYDSTTLLRHIIGSVRSDGRGTGGLEEMYDDILSDEGEIYVNSFNDGSGNPIYDMSKKGFEIKKTKDKSLSLSIDWHIQKIAEEELDKSGLKGSVCIMDSMSFSPLALASRGNFDQNDIEKYLDSPEGELIDRSTSSYDAGSIFKIITAAAALENNIADTDFTVECNGSVNIDGTEFPCHNKEGHGKVDMKDAFAKSCNVYFYKLGNMTGIKNIYNMAKKFSLGQKILHLPWENKGNSQILENTHPNEIANISIGQGNILITPIQAVNMVNIVANNGIMKKSHLVNGVINTRGVLEDDFREYREERVISDDVSYKIKEMMRSVMLYGTGRDYNITDTDICGKTGTAETGWVEDDDTMTHGWFVGFFPMDKPVYSIAVFLENGKSGYNAGKLFQNITKEIIRCGYLKK